jgi:hypothetical protein
MLDNLTIVVGGLIAVLLVLVIVGYIAEHQGWD